MSIILYANLQDITEKAILKWVNLLQNQLNTS